VTSHGVVSIDDVRRAADRLAGVAVHTPLVAAPELSEATGANTLLKCEQEQPVGAFKMRGACNAIAALSPDARAAGVITYSSGNHGQAVAYAGHRLGCRAVVAMPDHAPRIKVEGVKRWGGEVVSGGSTSASRRQVAEQMAQEQGLTIVPPFDHPDVIAGQATCTLEILAAVPDLRTLVVPVGGGGLLAGACTVVAALAPEVQVVAVEPVGAAKLGAALAAGRPVSLQNATSLADGLLPLSIGELTFPIIAPVLHRVVQVTDEDLVEAVRLLHRQGLRVEPSGAATSAALLAGDIEVGGTTVAIISGGNVDDEVFQTLVA
jgi:threonine dehydratase